MPISTNLQNHLDKQKPSIEAINRLLPDDIFPEFRDQVTSLLSNYEVEHIESKDVKDAIEKWNNKILAIGKIGEEKKKKEMIESANNTDYLPQELEVS